MDATVPFESSPSCNASASAFEAYMRQLHDFHRDNPIGMRGDVLALSLFFDGDWARFVRAWGLREPLLVRAFYYNHDQAYSTEVMIRYKYMPRLLRHQMKPSQVQAWDESKVNLLAQVLERAVKSGTVKDYKLVCKVATQIPGDWDIQQGASLSHRLSHQGYEAPISQVCNHGIRCKQGQICHFQRPR